MPLESLYSGGTGSSACSAWLVFPGQRCGTLACGHTWPRERSCGHHGRLRVTPLPSRSRVSVGAEILFCKEGCSVAVDTGASYITGPAGPISVLMKAIGAAEMAEGEVSKPLLCPAPCPHRLPPWLPVPQPIIAPANELSAISSSRSTWWTATESLSCPTSPSTWAGRPTCSAAQPTSSG